MRRGVRFVSVLVVLTLMPSVAGAQDADLERELGETNEERGRIVEEIEDTRAREADVRARLEQLDAELDAAEQALAELQQRLLDAEQVRDAAVAAAQSARDRLRAVREELAATEVELGEQKGQLHDRIRSAYMYGQVSFADAIAGTRELVDFLNSTTYVSHVLEADQQLVLSVEELMGRIEVQRAEAQQLRVEAEREAARAEAATRAAEQAAEEQAAATEQVRAQREERTEVLEQLRTDRAAMEGHLAGLEEESARIESQLAEIARQQEEERRRAEAAARQAAASGQASQAQGGGAGGSWTRPASGALSSPFGPRWGRNHNGVDLTGRVGSGIVAARAGVVVSAIGSCHPSSSWGCGGGFGNYVTVAHAGGLATIYAHLSAVSVGVGQRVDAGQIVGQMGNSGNSYGPHLHFEVREAGSPRNPCQYIGC